MRLLALGLASAALALLLAARRRKAALRGPDPAREPYSLLLTLEGARLRGVREGDVSVSFASAHDRRPHAKDGAIDEVWREKLASGARLFDQTKFRLRRIARTAAGVEMEVGLTRYKEYIGTHAGGRVLALQAAAEAAHGERRAHLSCALGCEAVLLTRERQVVLLRRSGATASHQRLYNGPSGHAEPAHAGVETHGGMCADSAAARVVRELFEAIVQEVHEETNIPKESLSEPLLIGAMEDSRLKPDLLFLLSTSLDAAAVRACYSRGATEVWESDKLVFWPADTIDSCSLPLTPVTRAAIDCFKIVDKR